MDLRDVLVRPVITEKSMDLVNKENKYTFIVHRQANKIQIKEAVEHLFKVGVLRVSTMKIPGKTRRQGRIVGHTRIRKKAVVKLKPGDKIELIEGM